MGWEAWLSVVAVIVLLMALASEKAPTDLLLLVCLTFLVTIAEVTGTTKLPHVVEGFAGFGREGVVTIGLLFVVVAGLMQTGATSLITEPLVGQPKSVMGAQLRLLIPVAVISAFMNNTPVVAMFLPVVDDLCRKRRLPPSKLFMPLAFAATFGGICTLIGTSTNLVVADKIAELKLPSVKLFDLTWIGVPCAIAGIIYVIIVSRWLLPDRKPAISLQDDPRQYTVEMRVESEGPLVGKTIEAAGLRHLPGLYLAEIQRGLDILPAVGSRERLEAHDRLIFVGIVESVVDLQKLRGLAPSTDQTFKLDAPQSKRCLIEAVVSPRCPLVGKTIREGSFRTVYNAAIIALGRAGERVRSKLGDVVLESGDTLLLEADRSFVEQQRNSSHFYLVSHVENSAPIRHKKAWMALAILAGMVILAFTLESQGRSGAMLIAALIASVLMIATRCCTRGEALQSIDWSVLVVIAASLGIGKALETSGAASSLAKLVVGLAQGDAWWSLAAIYFVTMVVTELVTNNTAAVLMFPIALESSRALGVNFQPFAIVLMVAASAGYATPFGYQTNMMVYGPGGYKFWDYVRFGVPLDLLFLVVTVVMTPLVFPFR